MSKIADAEANATSLDSLVNDNALVTTLRNGTKPSYQYLVDGWTGEIDDLLERTAGVGSENAYETTAAGIAATVNGDYFSVLSESDDNYLDLYKNDSGVALYIKSYPSYEVVKLIDEELQGVTVDVANIEYAITPDLNSDINGDNVEFAIVDNAGGVAFWVNSEGEPVLGDSKFKENPSEYSIAFVDDENKVAFGVGYGGDVSIAGADHSASPTNYQWAVIDKNGELALGIDEDGYLVYTEKPEPTPEQFEPLYVADNMMIESYGQSLSLGARGQPAFSLTQQYNNRMFASGLRWFSDQDLSSFVPLVESNDTAGSGADGQTVITSITDLLSDQAGYDDNEFSYIGSCSGLGGQPIANLVKGTTIYNRLIERVQAAYDLSVSESRSFVLYQMSWTQGEADYSAGTDPDLYKEMLAKLQYDITLDARDITGQKFKIPFVTYQPASHKQYSADKASIALALAEICEENDSFHMACPMYSYDYAPDLVHLTNNGYYMLGKYYGKAMDAISNGEEFQVCKVKSFVSQPRVITLNINVPTPPLVIDTSWVTETDNYGFDIVDTNGNLLDIIDSVSVIGDRIRIVTSSDIPSGSRLQYAVGRIGATSSGLIAGPRGNIRDSAGDSFQWLNGDNELNRGDNYLLITDLEL